MALTWQPGVHYLQGSAGQIRHYEHTLMLEYLGADRRGVLHLDGGSSASPTRLAQRCKLNGWPADFGQERVLYQFALNAHDWHRVMTTRARELAERHEPSLILVTHPLWQLTNHRLTETHDGRGEAYLRHGIETAHELAKRLRIPVIFAEDYAAISKSNHSLVETARSGIKSRSRILVDEGRQFLVPWTTESVPMHLRRYPPLEAFIPDVVPVPLLVTPPGRVWAAA